MSIGRDILIRQLMEQVGLDRPTAERRADAALADPRNGINLLVKGSWDDLPQQFPQLPPEVIDYIDPWDGKSERTTEAEERIEVRDLYVSAGCDMWENSQFRKARLRPGIPDAWVFPPDGHRLGWWHEVKRPGGERSPEQDEFMKKCIASRTPYVCGGLMSAKMMLRARRIIPHF